MIVYRKAMAADTSRDFVREDGEKWVEIFRTPAAALPAHLLNENPDLMVENVDGRRYRVRRVGT
ncbi:MAG: hypothetical protein HRF50_02060 [Phycisphaerae bacterium]|jgi:hypothetical protein